MERRHLRPGLEVAVANGHTSKRLGSIGVSKGVVVEVGPVARTVPIYVHPFHKIVNDGVIIQYGEQQVTVSPREILGTWEEHGAAKEELDKAHLDAAKHQKTADERRARNLGLLEMLVAGNGEYASDFERLKEWLATNVGHVTPRDIYLLLNAVFGYRVFDTRYDNE